MIKVKALLPKSEAREEMKWRRISGDDYKNTTPLLDLQGCFKSSLFNTKSQENHHGWEEKRGKGFSGEMDEWEGLWPREVGFVLLKYG